MKNILKHIIPVILAFALGALVFHSKPTPRDGCIELVPAKAISYAVVTNVPVIQKEIRFQTDSIHDTTFLKIDTAEVVNDWLVKRYYNPTILNDTNGLITVKFMVTRNKLAEWEVQKKLFTHSYKIYEPPARKLFLGGGILAYPDKFGLAAGGLYLDKHEHAFGLMYDPLGKGFFLSAYWKLTLKRKK